MEDQSYRPDPVDALVARLYRNALAIAPDRFRAWALQQVASVVPCDAALWGSGGGANSGFHTSTAIGVPADFPQRLEATSHINPLLPRILSNLEQPVDMQSVLPDADFHTSEIYRQVFGPLGIERILSTAHLDARSRLYSLVTLYRRDATKPFTVIEQRQQQRITYHLFNAASHGYFLHLLRNTERALGSGAAVVDRQGLFHEVQPRFHELLDRHYPGASPDTPSLPFSIPAPGQTVTHGKLCVRCKSLGDVFMLLAWEAGPLDRLTARERDVVMSVAQGLSFKQAARKIGVAPSTVANHLYRVYRKLGVSSRAELATLVHPQS